MVDALGNLDLDPSSASSASLLLRDGEDNGQNSTTATGTDTTRVVELPCGHEIRMTREEMEELERRELERGDMMDEDEMDEDEGFRCEECGELDLFFPLSFCVCVHLLRRRQQGMMQCLLTFRSSFLLLSLLHR